jgi:AraC family transcriptional regulator
MQVEADLTTDGARIQLIHRRGWEPDCEVVHHRHQFRLEMSLSPQPRSARACFGAHWSNHRFEQVGDVFLVPLDTQMMMRSDERSSHASLLCMIEADVILPLLETVPDLNDEMLMASLDLRSIRLRSILSQVNEEIRQPNVGRAQMIDLLIKQAAIELVRFGCAIQERSRQGGLAPWQLRAIDERLRRIDRAPSLAELGSLCRISVRQLTRGFSTSRGCPIGAYVANNRSEHAKGLLSGEMSVTMASQALGFTSVSNFIVAFKRATGMTPGRYRQLTS